MEVRVAEWDWEGLVGFVRSKEWHALQTEEYEQKYEVKDEAILENIIFVLYY